MIRKKQKLASIRYLKSRIVANYWLSITFSRAFLKAYPTGKVILTKLLSLKKFSRWRTANTCMLQSKYLNNQSRYEQATKAFSDNFKGSFKWPEFNFWCQCPLIFVSDCQGWKMYRTTGPLVPEIFGVARKYFMFQKQKRVIDQT